MALCGRVVFPSCANDLPSPNDGEVYYNTTNNNIRIYGGAAPALGWYTWEDSEDLGGAVGSIFATGGTIVNNLDGSICHVFESTGTLSWKISRFYCAFAWGGGGGGGYNVGAAGGGGRALQICTIPGNDFCKPCTWSPDNYFCGNAPSPPATSDWPVVIGAGGTGGASSPVNDGGRGFITCIESSTAPSGGSTLWSTQVCGGAGKGNGPGVANFGYSVNGGAAGCCGGGAGAYKPSAYPNGGTGWEGCDNPGQCRTSGGGGNWGIEGPATPTNPTCRACECQNSISPTYGGMGTCSYAHPDLYGLCFGGGGAGSTHQGSRGDRHPDGTLAPLTTTVAESDARRSCVWGGGCGGAGCLPSPSGIGGNAKGPPYYGGGGGGGAWNQNGGNGSSGVVIIKYCCII
jgi:hypothetical protein